MDTVRYRHPTREDVPSIAEVINLSRERRQFDRDQTVEETMNWTFGEKDYDPVGFLVAIRDWDIVAYGGSHVSDARVASGKNDAWIGMAVVPGERGRGIEDHLMTRSLEYLKGRGIGRAMSFCLGRSGWKHELAERFGFSDLRHSYVMVFRSKEAPERVPFPEGVVAEDVMLREANDDIVGEFVGCFNDSFADHFNFAPAPVERFIKAREEDTEPLMLMFARAGGETAGVCMCEDGLQYMKQRGERIGWINILGVRKGFRRRGIGRALLARGMGWVRGRGNEIIFLGMDAENEKALGLYTSLGFGVEEESVNYSLELDERKRF